MDMNIYMAGVILGINKDDTLEMIEDKYQKLMTKYRIDYNPGDDAMELDRRITDAYLYVKSHFSELKNVKEMREYFSYEPLLNHQCTMVEEEYRFYEKYADEIDETYTSLKCRYELMNKNPLLTFPEWLEQEIQIKRHCQELRMPRCTLYFAYYQYRMFNKRDLSFLNWTMQEIIPEKYCDMLGKSKKQLYQEYNREKKDKITTLHLLDWLEEKCNNTQNKEVKKRNYKKVNVVC